MLFSGAPEADALAAAADAEIPDAFRVIAPVAVMLRAVVADTAWFAIVRASPTPTAAVDPPDTTAPAVEEALAFCVAVPVNAPVSDMVPSVPTRAVVVTFDRVTAIAGAMSTAMST
ncbi:hypothetical protein AB4Z22_45130, partial [Paenibacillus sp. TAF58]